MVQKQGISRYFCVKPWKVRVAFPSTRVLIKDLGHWNTTINNDNPLSWFVQEFTSSSFSIKKVTVCFSSFDFYIPRNEGRGVYWNHPVRPSVDEQFARLGKMVQSA